jgi:hypothetical protein
VKRWSKRLQNPSLELKVKIGVDEGGKFKMRIRMQIEEVDRKKEIL